MTISKDLARLRQITELVLDVKLTALHRAASKRQSSLELLATLDEPLTKHDLPPVLAYRAELRYQNWADTRRVDLNIQIARQTAEVLSARDDAAFAFGKNQALHLLGKKLGQS